MIKLYVKDFSCIDEATLTLSPLTVLVGPQASGKSVACKLIYFFVDLLTNEQFRSVEDQKKLEDFKQDTKTKFKEWFPVTAWGPKRFFIEFSIGSVVIRLSRQGTANSANPGVRVHFTQDVDELYERLLTKVEAALERAKREKEPLPGFSYFWEIREQGRRGNMKLLRSDYVASQLYVPAGRSFFTSIGKAVAAFEQGRMLDPVTIDFGRFYTAYREWQGRRGHFSQLSRSRVGREVVHQLFGGELRFERDKEYVQTDDGRKIPLSALSSGQQELLPLWIALGYLDPDVPQRGSKYKSIVYIEEPEAHLFPSAQSLLVELLAEVLGFGRRPVIMMLTTHSPYVLAKINNLVKAGALGAMTSDNLKKVDAVIKKSSWLKPGSVMAYAFKDRKLQKIIDSDGMIDASYVDDISGDIAREFSRLLSVEVG